MNNALRDQLDSGARSACSVLSCTNAAGTVLDLTVDPADPAEVPVCDRHGITLIG